MKALNYIKQNYWLAAILLLASFLRLFHLNFQSVWMDEIYTLNVSDPSLTLKQLHDEVVLREGFPYLYFLILRVFYFIFGYTEMVARLVSALGGIAGVAAIYIFGKNIFNRQVGILAALMLAINEFHIAASQDARPYTLFVLFALIAFYRLAVFMKQQSFKNALWFGLAAGLMLNINFFALITLFAQALLLLAVIIFSPKENRMKLFGYSLFAGLLAILLFLPNYEIFIKLMNFQSFWVPAPQADSFTLMFREFLGNSEITRIIYMTILFYYIVILFREKIEDFRFRTTKDNPLNFSFVILFVWFTSYFGLLYVKSYIGTSLVLSRYFITLVPVILMLLAMGIYLINNRIAKTAVIAAVLFFSLFNLVGAKKYYTTVTKSQYREVSAFIKENNTTKSPVYTSLKYWYSYFLERGDNKQLLIDLPLEEKVNQMMRDSTTIKSFWYTDAHSRPYTVSPAAQAFLDQHFYVSDNLEGVDAWTRFYELKKADAVIDISKFGILKPANGDAFNYSVEVFEKGPDKLLKTSGWAYLYDQDATQSKISLVLIKDGKAKKIPALKVIRPDVNTYFKLDYNAENAGFTGEYDTSLLEPGQYQLGIYIVNKATNKEGLAVTDKLLQVP
jgi:uncharacterized membrane protein